MAPYEADAQLAYLSSLPEREGGVAAGAWGGIPAAVGEAWCGARAVCPPPPATQPGRQAARRCLGKSAHAEAK